MERMLWALFMSCLVAGRVALPGLSRADNTHARKYLDLAKNMAERALDIRQQRELGETGADREVPKAEALMSAYKRMGPKTRELETLEKEQQKRDLELESLAMLALGEEDADNILRQLSDSGLDLFTRQQAVRDPNCNKEITCEPNDVYRKADGTCNNLANPLFGAAGIQHLRVLPFDYDNNRAWSKKTVSVLHRGRDPKFLPNPRNVSNALHMYPGEGFGEETPSRSDISQMTWAWGQFIAHDMVRTPDGDDRGRDCCAKDERLPAFCMPIEAPEGDPVFPKGFCMPAKRSKTVLTCDGKFQNQINEITAFIDGSMIYGSSEEEMQELRTGTAGLLRESTRSFPPNDTSPDAVCDRQSTGYWCAKSELRANVVPSLTMLHTIFLREHNRIATKLGEINSGWDDEKIFQEARKIVAAELQLITNNEFLPVYLSQQTLDNYGLTTPTESYSYDPTINPSIMGAFSIAFRGHSLIPKMFRFFNDHYQPEGLILNTTQTFLHPYILFENNYHGIESTGRWVVGEKCPKADRFMEGVARNELFQSISQNGKVTAFDLAALNNDRGRDWGLPGYAAYRELCGLGSVTDWTDLTDHTSDVIDILKKLYHSPMDIDLYAGAVSETITDGSMAGPTSQCLIGMQFKALKYGDRFWFENTDTVAGPDGEVPLGLTTDFLSRVKKVKLAKILCDNLEIPLIQEDAFRTSAIADMKNCANLDWIWAE